MRNEDKRSYSDLIQRGELVRAIRRLLVPESEENRAYNAGVRRALKKVQNAEPAQRRK